MAKLFPVISEKANFLAEAGVYAFRVNDGSNKLEIKRAIEKQYKVHVTKVNLVNIPAKKRYIRGKVNFKSGHKKAMIYLAKGEKIEIA